MQKTQITLSNKKVDGEKQFTATFEYNGKKYGMAMVNDKVWSQSERDRRIKVLLDSCKRKLGYLMAEEQGIDYNSKDYKTLVRFSDLMDEVCKKNKYTKVIKVK